VLTSFLSSFSEHIDELRRRLKVVFGTLVALLVIVAAFPGDASLLSDPTSLFNGTFISHTILSRFLARIVEDILPTGWKLIAAGGLGEALEIYFVAALAVAFALAIPVIAYETYRFIDPALKENERSMLYPFITASSALFAVGLLFGYFVLAKFLIFALGPFFSATQLSFQVDGMSFYLVVFLLILAGGISFTTPVFVYAVIRLGFVDASFFSRNRVVIWFATLVVTALFLTPDGGPLLDLVLFVPIVSLLEVAVFLANRGSKPPKTDRDSGRAEDRNCSYCSAPLGVSAVFCPRCGRAPE
jgi:sec-independent protein translocase protein TatC